MKCPGCGEEKKIDVEEIAKATKDTKQERKLINKYGVSISPDCMEFGMTHGPFDFEVDALAVENPMEAAADRPDKDQYRAYLVGFEEKEGVDDPGYELLYVWEDGTGWKRLFPRVVHCKREDVGPFIYIGRGSKWGNPFKIGVHGSREEVIMKYAEWLLTQPELLDALPELRGQNLGCYCAPEPCHGDILLELANVPEPKPTSVLSDKEREQIPWEFGKYISDAEDFAVKANEWERYDWLTRDGVGREETSLFMAGFTRGLAWGLFKAGQKIADEMRSGPGWPDDDDIPF